MPAGGVGPIDFGQSDSSLKGFCWYFGNICSISGWKSICPRGEICFAAWTSRRKMVIAVWSRCGEEAGLLSWGQRKRIPKHFSPEPCESSSRDFTHGTVLVLTLIKTCTGEQTDESAPQKTSINSVKPQAEFVEPIARGMRCCVKRRVCLVSSGSLWEHFRGLGMHAGLSPCHVKKIQFFLSCSSE